MQNEKESILAAGKLFQLITGFMPAQAIHVAAKLDIAGHIQNGVTCVEDLANTLGCDTLSLKRLLQTLVQLGVFCKTEETYGLMPLSEFLLDAHPLSLRPFTLLIGDDSWWRSWGKLDYSVQRGKPAFDMLFHTDYTSWLEDHPELQKTFNQSMNSVSNAANHVILQQIDLSGIHTLVDIGGGTGGLLTALSAAYPEIQCTLFDLPHVVESVEQENWQIVGGDFFESVPADKQVYVMKQILHDWNDEQCIRILQNIKKAMLPNSRILVIESVLNADNSSVINYLMDLHMLATATGKERTSAEFKALFEKAGLILKKITPTASTYCILEVR